MSRAGRGRTPYVYWGEVADGFFNVSAAESVWGGLCVALKPTFLELTDVREIELAIEQSWAVAEHAEEDGLDGFLAAHLAWLLLLREVYQEGGPTTQGLRSARSSARIANRGRLVRTDRVPGGPIGENVLTLVHADLVVLASQVLEAQLTSRPPARSTIRRLRDLQRIPLDEISSDARVYEAVCLLGPSHPRIQGSAASRAQRQQAVAARAASLLDGMSRQSGGSTIFPVARISAATAALASDHVAGARESIDLRIPLSPGLVQAAQTDAVDMTRLPRIELMRLLSKLESAVESVPDPAPATILQLMRVLNMSAQTGKRRRRIQDLEAVLAAGRRLDPDDAGDIRTAALEEACRAAAELQHLSEHDGTWVDRTNAVRAMMPEEPEDLSAEELCSLATFFHASHLMHPWHYYARVAQWFGDLGFERLPPESEDRRQWLVQLAIIKVDCVHATGGDDDLWYLLDAYEELWPLAMDESRGRISSVFGSVASTMIGLGSDRERELADRVVRYFGETLALARHEEEDEMMPWALEQASTAYNLHYRLVDDETSLVRAIELARESHGLEPTLEITSTLAWMLHLDAERSGGGGAESRDEAIMLQARLWSARPEERRAFLRKTGGDTLFWVTAEEHEQSPRKLLDCWHDVLSIAEQSGDVSVIDALANAHRAVELADVLGAPASLKYTVDIADHALDIIESSVVHANDPRFAMTMVQGLSAKGAVAAVALGMPELAMNLLERGAGVLRKQQLARAQVATDDSEADGQPEVSRTPRTLVLDLPVLTSEAEVTLAYVASTTSGAVAIVQSLGEPLVTVLLPGLTVDAVEGWLGRLADDVEGSVSRGVVRGPRGSSAPSAAQVTVVITELREAVGPLLDLLDVCEGRSTHLVPCGVLAGLPWLPCIEPGVGLPSKDPGLHETFIQWSALAFRHAWDGRADRSGGVALTSPDPCTFEGVRYGQLPSARREGEWLRSVLAAEHFSQVDATAGRFESLGGRELDFVHVAVHGAVDESTYDFAHLLWANDPRTGRAGSTGLSELGEWSTPWSVVFLAACWSGRPDPSLPDEVNSFPTALLASGVGTVIAPLWPVDDEAARAFVTAFYGYWKLDGRTPAVAMQLTRRDMRASRRFGNDSTWAAFAISGTPGR